MEATLAAQTDEVGAQAPQLPTSRGKEFWAGVMGVAPLLLGVVPFGLIYGVLAVGVGLPAPMAQGMSMLVFAGSAQFITAQLLGEGAPLLVIIATAITLNLRHLLYSASVAPYLQGLTRGWKALLAYLTTDEAYAVAISHYLDRRHALTWKHWYFLGAGLPLWVVWQVSTAVGILLGAQVPAAWSLDFALPLTFIAIVVPALRDRALVSTALIAGIAALLAFHLPLKLGLMTAILLAIVAGALVDRQRQA